MTGYVRQDTGDNIAAGKVASASDIDNEFDAVVSAFNETTGHAHDGSTAEGAPIEVTGPAQEYLSTASAFTPKTDNTYDLGSSSLGWKDLYVDGTATLGAITLTTDLAVTHGGTGASTAAAARTNLGLVIGTDVQAQSADLNTYISNPLTAGELGQLQNIDAVTITGAQWGYLGSASAFGGSLIDDADATAARTTLGLGTLATQDEGTGAGEFRDNSANDSRFLRQSQNLSDITNASNARSNLGLVIGTNVQAWDADLDTYSTNPLTAAELGQLQNINLTTISTTQWGYLGAATAFGGSLLDDANASAGRSTLGLGTLATQNSSSVTVTALTVNGDANFDSGTLFVDVSENRVGIGTTSPGAPLDVNGSALFNSIVEVGGLGPRLTLRETSSEFLDLTMNSSVGTITSSTSSANAPITFAGFDGSTTTEYGRFSNLGEFLLGSTSSSVTGGAGVRLFSGGLIGSTRSGTSGTHVQFANDNGIVGSISTSGTSTAYNTTSGRKFKKDIIDYSLVSGDLIDALQPRTFSWKADNKVSQGFIADEFAEVFPQSVNYDEETGEAIGIDAGTPEVIAMLVAEIKSLRQRVAALEV